MHQKYNYDKNTFYDESSDETSEGYSDYQGTPMEGKKESFEITLLIKSLIHCDWNLVPSLITSIIMTSTQKFKDAQRISDLLNQLGYFILSGDDSIVVSDGCTNAVFDFQPQTVGCFDGDEEEIRYSYYLMSSYLLWKKGLHAAQLGEDVNGSLEQNLSEFGHDVEIELLISGLMEESLSYLVEDAEDIASALLPIDIEEIPMEHLRPLVFDSIDKFYSGEEIKIHTTKSYIPSRILGSHLPTTVHGTDWVVKVVSSFIQSEFTGCKLAINTTNCMLARKFEPDISNEIFFSRDQKHPLWWDTNPGLVYESLHDNWSFRDTVMRVYAQTDASKEFTHSSNKHKKNVRKVLIKDRLPVKEFSYTPSFSCQSIFDLEVMGDCFRVIELNSPLHSKYDDVVNFKDSLHVVSTSLAFFLSDRDWYKVLLQDLQTVLLIPQTLWKFSSFYRDGCCSRLGRSGITPGYSSSIGMEFSSTDLNPYLLWYKFLGATFKKKMFDAWSKGDQFVPALFSLQILSNFEKGRYDYFFPREFSPYVSTYVINRLVTLVTDSYTGITVAPKYTLIGKHTSVVKDGYLKFNLSVYHSTLRAFQINRLPHRVPTRDYFTEHFSDEDSGGGDYSEESSSSGVASEEGGGS